MSSRHAFWIAVAALLIAVIYWAMLPAKSGSKLPHSTGTVADGDTAIQITVAAWEPIYGADKIASEKPYRVHETADAWIVEGSLPKETVGGVAVAEIAKADGRVVRVSHGR